MAAKVPAELETLWGELLPALARAWDAYEQLHGIPASAWPEQERALFGLRPGLYREYTAGLTPAMERGSARAELIDQISIYARRFGQAALRDDLEGYLQIKPQAAK